jgi:hypothetical protein
LENISVGHGVSLLCWRSGGVEHPHDTPPYPFMPSPTSAHSSSHQRNTENSRTNAAAYEIRADGGHTAFRFSATTPKANRSDVKDQIRNSGTQDCRRAKNR